MLTKRAKLLESNVDGSCLFDSVAKALKEEGWMPEGKKKVHTAASLRSETVMHLELYWVSDKVGKPTYSEMWDKLKPQDAEEECDNPKLYYGRGQPYTTQRRGTA